MTKTKSGFVARTAEANDTLPTIKALAKQTSAIDESIAETNKCLTPIHPRERSLGCGNKLKTTGTISPPIPVQKIVVQKSCP